MKTNIQALFTGIVVFALLGIFSEVSAQTRDITFPVDGEYSFRNDFAEPRGDGSRTHQGIDIIADKMTPVVSAVDGTITNITRPQASWGYSITIRDSEGYTYRYLHLNNDTPGTDDGNGGEENAFVEGLRRRSTVEKGEHIGWVGDSGNAEGTVSHLHFEIRAPDRIYINPYQSLIASSKSGTGQTVTAVTHATTEVSIDDEEVSVVSPSTPPSSSSLSKGSRGEAVRALQIKLIALGYFSEEATGYFGSITESAVIAFQKDNSIDPIGIVGPKTRQALDRESSSTTPPPTSTPTASFTFTKYLEVGSRGEEVKKLQLVLKKEGYFSEEATGYFGSITKASLIAFQNANAIEGLGIVGPKTRTALNALE